MLRCLSVVLLLASAALLPAVAAPADRPPGLIAFTRADGIYVVRADGSGERPLRRGGAAAGALRLAWSPDGRRLAFTNLKYELWTMDADGSGPVRLVVAADISARVLLGPLTWSPDGRRIAFTAIHRWSAKEKQREWDVYVVGADGTNPHRLLTTPGLYEFELDWSATGDRIAFTDMNGMFSRLRVMSTTGKILRTVNRGRGYEIAMPNWSPDGRRLAFVEWPVWADGSTTLREAEILVTSPSGRWLRLTHDRDVDSSPVWSPDGRRIAFVHGREPGTVLLLPPAKGESGEIHVVNADGTGLTRLTHGRPGVGSLAWQPVAR